MKKDIHPTYYPDAVVVCACGNTFTVGSTVKIIRTDVCSACHPFFTGEQRIVDTAGQVDRFMKRLQAAEAHASRQKKKKRKVLLEIVEEEGQAEGTEEESGSE